MGRRFSEELQGGAVVNTYFLLHFFKPVLYQLILRDSDSLVEEGHDGLWVNLLGHIGEADNVHEKDCGVVMRPGQAPNIFGNLPINIDRHMEACEVISLYQPLASKYHSISHWPLNISHRPLNASSAK